ncbi:hypothetical protein BU26DRAFT_52057 [Trematosphaeria pertusa]|uniref:Uncharacterized protein n=1 Tax=Trematosphaeria pertusa TaxID=390896 RepID=A0A6A6I8P2_9PLEO|nr:uncharacterized protein BU26DRAFT_52057 [Trematosphaeria pertusa]KAF2246726.1 hypothetical protein BU26DRAFT_52057 [Trematosphaeria pertusa]
MARRRAPIPLFSFLPVSPQPVSGANLFATFLLPRARALCSRSCLLSPRLLNLATHIEPHFLASSSPVPKSFGSSFTFTARAAGVIHLHPRSIFQ